MILDASALTRSNESKSLSEPSMSIYLPANHSGHYVANQQRKRWCSQDSNAQVQDHDQDLELQDQDQYQDSDIQYQDQDQDSRPRISTG